MEFRIEIWRARRRKGRTAWSGQLHRLCVTVVLLFVLLLIDTNAFLKPSSLHASFVHIIPPSSLLHTTAPSTMNLIIRQAVIGGATDGATGNDLPPAPLTQQEAMASSSFSVSSSSSLNYPSYGNKKSSIGIIRVRPAQKKDLTKVATMQILEYGGDASVMFLWHWFQELDRLQTSFWYDPGRHQMLVCEELPPPSPFTTTSSSNNNIWTSFLSSLSLLSPFFGNSNNDNLPTKTNKESSIIGFVDIDSRPNRVDRTTPVPYLSDLIVTPTKRGQGVARRLMKEAEEVCRTWNLEVIYLKVRRSNRAGLALYSSLGYNVIKDWGDGVLTMRKWLVDESIGPVAAIDAATAASSLSSIPEEAGREEGGEIEGRRGKDERVCTGEEGGASNEEEAFAPSPYFWDAFWARESPSSAKRSQSANDGR